MGIYKAEIANMRKNIGENVGQKIIIKEPAGKEANQKKEKQPLRELTKIISW